MEGVKYEQLLVANDADEDEVSTKKPLKKNTELCLQTSALSLTLILIYFSLSIGLTFYQRWLLKDFHYPLTVVMYHLIIKWILAVCVRTVLWLITGSSQLILSLSTCIRSVGPTGLASGIDVGFSNWGLELVTISLYTMTKSTTIIFILIFAIILGLEKKSWSLVGIVLMIAAGLLMFTYKATQFNLLGFNFLLVASFAAGLRWTFAQLLMQKSKLGLHNPIDMVFHVQPFMFLSLLPFMAWFEGFQCFDYLSTLSPNELWSAFLKVSVGATIAFAMELSEFLVVTYTSSLTLSIAGIFKEIWILVLAIKIDGDQLSRTNSIGLALCLLGISGHIIHKVIVINSTVQANDEQMSPAIRNRSPRHESEVEPFEPLLDYKSSSDSDANDVDSNIILYEVVQRRDD